jgi:alcohol dehydrogenase class IV
MSNFTTAQQLISKFKGERYLHGMGVLSAVGPTAAELGKRAVLVRDSFPGFEKSLNAVRESMIAAGLELAGEIPGAAPNAPREDVARITAALESFGPEVVVSFGGGSTIDAAKAAIVLCSLGGGVDDYFGTGLVTQALEGSGKKLIPHLAVQTAASSAAHLTKYSNITDVHTGQKKLIVDPAIVPQRAIFDYGVTFGAPATLTADGALDGVSHCLEVLYSAVGKPDYEKIEPVALEGIRLVVEYLPRVIRDPQDAEAREALGLATDLGGYAIMLGGTNGAHLTSFSLVDVLSHGRACAMMNPYYTMFFAPAIQGALKAVGEIYWEAGYTGVDIQQMSGRSLGCAVAEAMIAFERAVGFPTRLREVPGFSDEHISRALTAAKNPQLKMKLENMPVPLTAEMVDEFMGPILWAARDGDLGVIKNV